MDFKTIIDKGNPIDPLLLFEKESIPFTPDLIPGHFFYIKTISPYVISEDNIPYDEDEYERDNTRFYVTRKPYYDMEPFGLCLFNSKPDMVSIVDFKVIPLNIRYLIILRYINLISKYVEISHDKNMKPKVSINDRLTNPMYISPFMSITSSVFNEMIGSNMNFAINNYNKEYIMLSKFIDWHSVLKLAKCNVTSNGLVINRGIGGIDGIFERFISKM